MRGLPRHQQRIISLLAWIWDCIVKPSPNHMSGFQYDQYWHYNEINRRASARGPSSLENTMLFKTTIAGIPCQCRVLAYRPDTPIRVYGPAMEDFDPPEEGELDYEILDRKGYRAKWLEKRMTDKDEERIKEEIHLMWEAEFHDLDSYSEYDPSYEGHLDYVDGTNFPYQGRL